LITENDKAIGVTFSAPSFNGRTANHNIQVCHFLF
jgi:hypothetical protein